MKKIGYIIGEDCDLPQEYITRHAISVFKYSIVWNGINTDSAFYETMRSAEKKGVKDGPKTSQPSIETFLELYKSELKKYEQLIVVTISSHLSGTYNSAMQAIKHLEEQDKKRVTIIDSLLTSGAEGIFLMDLISMEEKGQTSEGLINYAVSNRNKYHALVTFDDPIWLERNGRLNPVLSMIVRNLLKGGFRPLLTIKEGKIVPLAIQRNGSGKVQVLFSRFKEVVSQIQDGHDIIVGITHADCKKEALELSELISNFSKDVTVAFVHDISPVLGAHIGPGGLVLSFK